MVKVLSVGGSIVAPEKIDIEYLLEFSNLIRSWLAEEPSRKLILVIGGGAPARNYQKAYKEISERSNKEAFIDEADWIGITATYLNAQLVKAIFSDICLDPVVHDPTRVEMFSGQILVASGWKPGFSTDNDAVLLAERFSANQVLNLSNIEKVYTDDPKTNPDAKPIDKISWEDFIKIVGEEWIPGKHLPFDPIASARAKKRGIQVICANGRNLKNIRAILDGEDFVGTTIG